MTTRACSALAHALLCTLSIAVACNTEPSVPGSVAVEESRLDDDPTGDGDGGDHDIVSCRDEVDWDDDPFTPGCHRRYANDTCTRDLGMQFTDTCKSDVDLLEFINPECHPNWVVDTVLHNCDDLCYASGFMSGICWWDDGSACAGTYSAYCTCLGWDGEWWP